MRGIIGEVEDGGITVRIYHSYEELGLPRANPHRVYVCESRGELPIPEVVSKMRVVAKKAAEMNAYIPDQAAAQRVALVMIYGPPKETHYVMAHGKGAMVLSEDEFRAGIGPAAIAHELGHAVFEYHIESKVPGARVPDAVALRIADLFWQLNETVQVPLPTARFDPAAPPSLIVTSGATTHAAGTVMVMDTLWSGTGGHPWENAEEFFASAFAGSVEQPVLFRQIIKHYETADKDAKKIAPLAKDLLGLLAIAKDPAALKKLEEPRDPAAATQAVAAIQPTPEMTAVEEELKVLRDPTQLRAPKDIPCPGQVPEPSLEEPLEGGAVPKP